MGGIPYCLDRVSQSGTVRRKKQVAFQKTDFLFTGRDYRVFGSAPFPGCGYRFAFLYNFLSDDRIYSLGGIQLFCMGILGEYLAKTYLETKHRPIYILKESSGESYKDRSREKNDEKTTDR